jgi:hypothetical protein
MMASGLGAEGVSLDREIVATGGFGQAGGHWPLLGNRRAAIAVLAVKATRFAGGFAGLDGSARRWLLAIHVLLVSDRGRLAASRTKRTW